MIEVKAYFVVLSLFLGIYAIGHFLISFSRNSILNTSFFVKSLLGLLLTLTTYSIILSEGQTIHGLNLILFLFLFISNRKKISLSNFKKNIIRIDSSVLIYSFFLMVLLFLFGKEYSDFQIPSVYKIDYFFYGKVAAFLRDFAVESINPNLFFYEQGVTPYHYSELWIAAMVSSLLDIHILKALFSITYPILLVLVYSGAVELINIIKNRSSIQFSYIHFILGFLVFIVGIPNLGELLGLTDLSLSKWLFPGIAHLKYIFLYIYGLGMIASLLSKQYILFIYFVCFSIVSQVSVSITLGSSSFLILLFLYKKDELQKKHFFNSILLLSITTIYFYLFYSILGKGNNISLSIDEILHQFNSKEEILLMINIIGKTTIQLLFNLLPLILLMLFAFTKVERKKKRILLLLLIIIHFSGIIIHAVLNKMHDSVQLWSNEFNVIINLLLFVSIIFLFLKQKEGIKKYGILIVSYLLFTILQLQFFSNKIIKTSKPLTVNLKGLKKARFAFIKEKEDYINSAIKYEHIYFGQAYNLMLNFDPLIIACISTDAIIPQNLKEEKYVKSMTFNIFLEKQKESKQFQSYEDSQIEFLKKYKINYLLMNQYRKVPIHLNGLFSDIPLGKVDGYYLYEIRTN